MKSIRQLLIGLLSAIATSLIVFGAGTLALVEGDVNAVPLPMLATQIPLVSVTPIPGEPSPQPVTPTATWVKFIQCNVPHGWQPYEVKPADSLDAIASRVGLAADDIYKKNCLQSASLPPGTILYLPAPTPTPTVTASATPTQVTLTPSITPTPSATSPVEPPRCGPPPGWVTYIVRPGDTIFRLSVATGTSQYQLVSANCLSSDRIYAGQRLYVPFIPAPPATQTPTPTDTDVPEPTAIPSDTPDLTATAAAQDAANQTATAAAQDAANQTATAAAQDAANQTATAAAQDAANQTATAAAQEAANQTATAVQDAANQAATSVAATLTAQAGTAP